MTPPQPSGMTNPGRAALLRHTPWIIRRLTMNRRTLWALGLAGPAALAAVLALRPSATDARPAGIPAPDAPRLPVTRAVLFSAGVGHFVREGEVEGERAGGDGLDLEVLLLAEAHDGAASELFLNRTDSEVNCAGTLVGQCHRHLFESPFILRLRRASP